MKRTITLLLILCCLVSSLCLNISAAEELEPEDSRYISPEMAGAVCDKSTIVTVKAYAVILHSAFDKYSSIEEILSNAKTRYFQENSEGWYDILPADENGCYQKNETTQIDRNMVQEFKTGEAIKTVSPDITVKGIYYLDGMEYYQRSAIYYKTNLGDYVYVSLSVGERLFSAEVFWDYMKAICRVHQAKHKGEMVTGGPNYDICDLSAYDFRSADFDPDQPLPEIEMPESGPNAKASDYLWILLIAVPLAAILGIWATKRRKPLDAMDRMI